MKLDFEKFLNDNGLKVGDRIKLTSLDLVYVIAKDGYTNIVYLKCLGNGYDRDITILQLGYEKVVPKKKVGDLLCENNTDCFKCPLRCINCGITCGGIHANDTLREVFEGTLKECPELEPMREYLESELDKEIKE